MASHLASLKKTKGLGTCQKLVGGRGGGGGGGNFKFGFGSTVTHPCYGGEIC